MQATSTAVPMVIGATLAAAMAGPAPATGDLQLRHALESVSSRAILFGHQSVGADILDGVRDIAAEQGILLVLEEVDASRRPAGPGWWHAFLPVNGDPTRKIGSFEAALDRAGAAGPDVAFMKFCYVDFDARTDVDSLFERYRQALRRLQTRFPRTEFLHITVPLHAASGGLKSRARKLVGRDTEEDRNAQREAFNALLRGAYAGREPLFDLARLESTGADGRRTTISWDGREVPVMATEWTSDGGHLNERGRRMLAMELVRLLASLQRKGEGPATARSR